MIGTLGPHSTPLRLHCRAQRGRAVAVSIDDHRRNEPMAQLNSCGPGPFLPSSACLQLSLLTS
jgi:hypothetical protein